MIDLTHGIARHDVRAGASCWPTRSPYLPVGRAPGGRRPRRRRASGARSRSRTADGRLLVGPDNGLLCRPPRRAGGIVEAVDIARSPVPARAGLGHLPRPRHLRAGRRRAWPRRRRWRTPATARSGRAGRARAARARARDGALVAHVRYVDRFGNLQLDAGHEDLARIGAAARARRPSVELRRRRARTPVHYAPDVRRRRARTSCCSTRTPSGGWRSRSTTATPPQRLGARARRRAADPPGMTARSGRRGCTCAVTDSTNARARELAARRRAARDAGHRRRADRRPRAPGPHLDRARRAARCCARW